MIRIHEILEKTKGYLSDKERELIQKAYVYSATAHAGQIRRSGEPYLSHPLEVANLLADMRIDGYTIVAGLLHDTVEDTKASIEDIDSLFGEEVADIVDGVTKISQMQMTFDTKEEAQAENIRKMVLAMSEDIRVLLVKLCDRLHNMRTLEYMKPHKQRAIAQETMDIYAPLSNRLGLHRIKVELEDLSLKYLKPDIYGQLQKGLHERSTRGQAYIDKVIELIEEKLRENNIKGRVTGRIKHIFSTFHKMEQQGLDLDQVHDLIAFRVIVPGIKDCYAVLGLAHADWKPVPGRFKDYISMPKANMYQSLHTTVIGPEGERIEIQIRTEEMHRIAEYGVASHWSYKEGMGKKRAKDMDRFSWLRQIMDWQKEESDPREFMKSLRFDLFKDEVYVFTPRGDVKELPEGATPVDFAYLIHSQVGDHCAGARVNGRLVPLSRKLRNGDSIEIITDLNRRPSRDWLKFVKTAKARTRVKHFIRTEERERSIALAREMLEKEGRKMGINVQKVIKAGQLDPIAAEFSFKSVDDLYSAIGYARLTPRQVLNKLYPKLDERDVVHEERPREQPAPEKDKGADKVRIHGVDDVLIRFAKCCNPLPGEPIIGYISRGKGVTVHTTDCPNMGSMEPERLLNIWWESDQQKPYPAKIRIVCRNKRGMLSTISAKLTEQDVNIDSGRFKSNVDGNSELIFTVEVRDSAHLYRALDNLSAVQDVVEAVRLATRGED
ncbi:GTP pyrophosphokinase [Desulfobaculum xiamenense]|uniref:GTP pyrophosphokinase n=1 Tax=Desulfobaculum xiamenense TaxID=995050 RepID=A0A846QEH0_9BACT|nr:bifunctional (p)ppGpp synthetase/guanosine-3',5'-bis(diphosphate) 3'-pyrophosphohydrolase [Desulfobaculum xiamenense]NJB67146.1 GTP pyrophosphokinase [Desulfobaculum xiamenense]